MVKYYKELTYYTQAHHQKVKATLPQLFPKDPPHGFQPGDFAYWKTHQKNTALEPHCTEPCPVLLTTHIAE